MQAQFHVDDCLQALMGLAQVGQGAALVGGQRIGPGEVDQEQVVLLQVVAKGALVERAGAEPAHEVVLDIGAPVVVAGGGEVVEAVAHLSSGVRSDPERAGGRKRWPGQVAGRSRVRATA
ncbi:hypothetical protein Q427_29145 [Halomonas sp. BC04]|nr:hypothetical protein Q427_29145 [Halomonas sp. BC04]